MKSNDTRDENKRIKRLIEIDKNGLPSDGGTAFNRLIFSKSPYLLQHAENPVDWHPWGEEAFARAAREGKPVFLSIGYATCHWCHVMAHESFDDREVAAALNRSFVCIKVDREERPDIDDEYMAAAQMMTGSGGWPLNIFMTPEKKPFFSATYLPRTQRMGLPGIIQLLDGIAGLWGTERQKLEERSTAILEALSRYFQPNPGSLPERTVAENACRQLTESYDELFGGFGSAPKFPIPLNISFLLRSWKRSGNAEYLAMAEHTLCTLRQGGICDQVGFGFHRYTVDRQWLVPHFEKMLYDQALIALAYMDAFQATGDPFHMRAAEEIFSFVLREMTSLEGGFFAGEDADSEGEEGKYYLWTPAEIAAVIGDEDARLFCRIFGVTEKGNFEGRNILHLPIPLESFSSREGVPPDLLAADLEQWRLVLLKAREGRVRPFRDEKIVTSWNGLMIAAFARGYALTGEGRYLAAADRATAFMGTKLTASSGRLMRSYHLGEASTPAFLEDYAFLILGLIELHQATLEAAYLDRALNLADAMLHLFNGDAGDGLFETGSDCKQLPVRRQNAQDVALPSGNGMAAFDLFRLGRITGDDRILKTGEIIARTFMGDVARQPLAFLTLISASDYLLGPAVTVTLSGKREELGEMLRTLHRRFIPDLAVRYGGADEDGEYPACGGRPTAHVCARGACLPPATGFDALNALLDDLE